MAQAFKFSNTFQSTPSAWRETFDCVFHDIYLQISIHSLRMEGDIVYHTIILMSTDFNPLPPHGGRRSKLLMDCVISIFQSTPSAWRETPGKPVYTLIIAISIHSLRMEGDRFMARINNFTKPISIHSLRMEGDTSCNHKSCTFCISIHSLRMEGDREFFQLVQFFSSYFNPLPPHGGRLTSILRSNTTNKFQSTPSAWRETRKRPSLQRTPSYFNPLPPHGGRRCLLSLSASPLSISIHSLRMEGDHTKMPASGFCNLFQSTPSAWRETSSVLS